MTRHYSTEMLHRNITAADGSGRNVHCDVITFGESYVNKISDWPNADPQRPLAETKQIALSKYYNKRAM